MSVYDDDEDDDDYMDEAEDLAMHFCEICDKNLPLNFDEDEFEAIIAFLAKYIIIGYKNHRLKKAVDTAIERYPHNSKFAVWRLHCMLFNAKYDESVDYFNEIVNTYPLTKELLEEIVILAYDFHLDVDIELYAITAVSFGHSAPIYQILCMLNVDKGNIEAAFNYFKIAAKINFEDTVDFIVKSVLLKVERNLYNNDNPNYEYDESFSEDTFSNEIAFLEKLSDAYPMNTDIWFLLGTICSKSGKHEKALHAFEFAYSLEQQPSLCFDIGNEYFMLQNYRKAIEFFNILHSYDNAMTAYVLLGKAYRKIGRNDLALESFMKARYGDHDFQTVFLELQNLLLETGQEDKLSVLDNFFQKNIREIEHIEWVIDYLSCNENSDEHENLLLRFWLYLRTRQLFVDDVDFCRWVAEFAYSIKDQAVAIRVLDYFAEVESGDLYFHLGYYYAVLYISLEMSDEAEKHLRNALIINEEGIYGDFLDIEYEHLYKKYDKIAELVQPFASNEDMYEEDFKF